MSAPDSVDNALLPGASEISAAADQARTRLHAEIERVRAGVEEMLDSESVPGEFGLRQEFEELRAEIRRYAKQRINKAEKRREKSVDRIDERTRWLEHRIDTVERDRERTEWRIHMQTEAMLDNLLREIRSISDHLPRAQ